LSQDLVTALNRGILETELNCLSSGIYESLSIISFNIQSSDNLNPKDANIVQNMFRSIYVLAEYNIFLHLYNTFLIFLKDKDESDISILLNEIRKTVKLCSLESGSIYADVNVTNVEKKDSLTSIIDKLAKLQKESKVPNIKTTPTLEKEEFNESSFIFNALKNIYYKQDKIVGIHNFYRGISLFRQVKLLTAKDGIIAFKTSPTRALVLQKDKFTYIRHSDLKQVVRGNILKVNVKNGLIYVDHFEFMQSSEVDRKYIRVEPKRKIILSVFVDKKEVAKGVISNVSVKAIAIATKSFKKEDIENKELKLKFLLPDMTLTKAHSVLIDAQYFNSNKNKIIFTIRPNRFSRVRLLEYIGARQKELIDELKHSLG